MNTRASRSERGRDSGGFTLTEVLIGITVLGVAGIAASALLAQMTVAGVDGRQEVVRHATAVAVMESLLVQDYDDLGLGTSTGTSGSGVDWTVTISSEGTGLRRLNVEAGSDGRLIVLESLRSDR